MVVFTHPCLFKYGNGQRDFAIFTVQVLFVMMPVASVQLTCTPQLSAPCEHWGLFLFVWCGLIDLEGASNHGFNGLRRPTQRCPGCSNHGCPKPTGPAASGSLNRVFIRHVGEPQRKHLLHHDQHGQHVATICDK